jgi:hypothetical protein
MNRLLAWISILFLPCRQGKHHECPGQANEYADAETKLNGPCRCSCRCHTKGSQ